MKYRNILLNNTKPLILVTHKNRVLIIPIPKFLAGSKV
jgi:hypothetical protein